MTIQSQNTECVITTYPLNEWGYGVKFYQGKAHKTHRIAFYESRGYWPEVCRHTCDNPACVNPEHLLDGTNYENVLDRVARKRNGRIDGELNGRSKITEEQACEIREMYKTSGLTQRSIGELYGLSNTQVSKIIRYKSFSGQTSNSKSID